MRATVVIKHAFLGTIALSIALSIAATHDGWPIVASVPGIFVSQERLGLIANTRTTLTIASTIGSFTRARDNTPVLGTNPPTYAYIVGIAPVKRTNGVYTLSIGGTLVRHTVTVILAIRFAFTQLALVSAIESLCTLKG